MLDVKPRSADDNVVSFPTRLDLSSTEYSSAKLWRPLTAESRRVALSDPATCVVTDFTREAPVTVTEDRPIDDALHEMMVVGVHALLVVRGDQVSGLVTSYDIQGERPLRLLLAPGHTHQDQIEVGKIMTSWDRIPKLDWSALSAARVRDLTKVFGSTSASHMLAVENVKRGGAFVRALISRRRLNRQLGRSID